MGTGLSPDVDTLDFDISVFAVHAGSGGVTINTDFSNLPGGGYVDKNGAMPDIFLFEAGGANEVLQPGVNGRCGQWLDWPRLASAEAGS